MERREGSVLDLFLILLLVLCAAGLLFRWQFIREKADDSSTEEIELVLESEAIDRQAAGCLSVGEVLYDASGEPIGRVISVLVETVDAEVLSEGSYYVGTWDRERLCKILVTVRCERHASSGGQTRVRGTLLSVGESVQLFSVRSALRYRILKITNVFS